jgi:two-component system response regulator FlrC
MVAPEYEESFNAPGDRIPNGQRGRIMLPDHIILIVEDEDVQRRQIARLLKAEGYGVLEASTGEEALMLLGKQEVRLVLTDRKMPGINGDMLLSYVKANYPQIPIALITAYPEGIDNSKPDTMLQKPFTGNQLRELVQQLM